MKEANCGTRDKKCDILDAVFWTCFFHIVFFQKISTVLLADLYESK